MAVDALSIKFSGGYGQFVDPESVEEYNALQFILCKSCTIDLCEAFPIFKEAVFIGGITIGNGHTATNKERHWGYKDTCRMLPCIKEAGNNS